MPRPLVSIIVPAYNCAEFVRDAIDSLLAQKYEPMEVVVVDDGSTDDTLKVLAEYGDRIRAFSQPNAGPAAARNRAVREARGEWLAFVDGDDLWLPGHPALAMSYIAEHPEAKVVFGEWLVWTPDEDGSFAPLNPPPPARVAETNPQNSGWVYPKLLFDSIIHIISSVVHRSVYDAVGGFDEGLRTGSDYDFWLKASRVVPFVQLRGAVAVYRQNRASVTHTIRAENNPYRLLKRAIDTYGLSDDAGHSVPAGAVAARLADLAFLHGYRHYWRGDARIAVTSFWQVLGHRPWHLKAAGYLLASWGKRFGVQMPLKRHGA